MDQKNMLLAIVISIAVIVGWQYLVVPAFFPPAPLPAPQVTPSGEPVPQVGGQQAEPATPSTGGEAALSSTRPRAEVLAESPRVPVETPAVLGSINLKGGQLDDLTLRRYHETKDPASPTIVLLSPRGTTEPYYAGVRWVAEGDAPVPDAETLWQAEGDKLTPTTPVTLKATLGTVDYEIVYAIDNDYMVTITQRVTNRGDAAIKVAPYAIANRVGIPVLDASYVVHEGMFGVLGDTYEEVDYDDLMDQPGGVVKQETTGGWLGFTHKYWSLILVPDQSAPATARYVYSRVDTRDRFQADLTYPMQEVAPGGAMETQVRVFAGAREPQVIDRYDEEGVHRFYLAVDYGWIFFLSRPIYVALHWFNSIVGNFGVAILLLVVCVRILLFPLANKAYKSMGKMRVLQPKMLELRERYKDDKARFQQEIMGLYKKEGANPLAGCLPILVQIPIFIALYNVLYGTIEMRHAPFFGWIQDLSAPDPTSWMNLFGLLPYDVPNLGILSFFSLGVWPILMGITMWLQYRLNPQPTDPMQAKIFAWMPIIFTFMLGQFAAGLVIYWAWNNTLSMAQQVIIMRRQGMPIGRKASAAAAAAAAAAAKQAPPAEDKAPAGPPKPQPRALPQRLLPKDPKKRPTKKR
jgi:YidC/Oxa1 family membrane protein insertase